ncbi:MAG TPA: ABC transporter permease [Stellaceae bacterium]|nr:ABC transporter permease [Stellaceae bacterium]
MSLTGRDILVRLLSILALLAVWEVSARIAASPLLPSATAVLALLGQEIAGGRLPHEVGVTLLRVAASFVLAMVSGTALGLAMGRWRMVDQFFDSWLTALLNLPALVLIVLLYVWFGLNDASAIAAVALNKLPATAVTVREGARALDRNLLEMAEAFQVPHGRRLAHVVLPQLYPYLFAAARSGLALIWKIVLVVELLGRSNGVGFEIQLYFQQFDVAHILAYSLAFMIVVQLIEWLVLNPLERRAVRWRP